MDSTTGKRIKELRKAKGLSVEALAEKLDVKPTAIYGLEKDANKPSFDTISGLVSCFPDLNPDWLINGQGTMFRNDKALTPFEAPATKVAPVTHAPVATTPAGGADPELLKEIRESRDQARNEATRAWKDAAYWRSLYLAEVKRYMNVEEPHEDTPESPASTAAPGKEEVDSFAAETEKNWIGGQHRDPKTGNVLLFQACVEAPAQEAEGLVRNLKPFTNPYLDLVIDETPEEELCEYALVKQA